MNCLQAGWLTTLSSKAPVPKPSSSPGSTTESESDVFPTQIEKSSQMTMAGFFLVIVHVARLQLASEAARDKDTMEKTQNG